ncbi:MAG: FtsX-like permease family protein [Epulopiscium sp.]|nr:FtsX-like permease family protein [Candidatus Epulonipiscium sp.]
MKKGERKYTVLGFFNALTLMYNGQYALIAQKYYKNDMDSPFYDELALKTSKDPEEMVEILNKKFKRNYPYINSVNQLRKDIMQSNSQMMGLLQGFSFMTVIIGIFGVLNNLLISFLERKRQLAIMRSIGMEKKQNTKMLFIESLTGGLIGSITGVIGGIFVNYVIEHLLEAMNLPMNIHLSPSLFVSSFIIGTMVMVMASISPNLKSSKYNIIEAIKYE